VFKGRRDYLERLELLARRVCVVFKVFKVHRAQRVTQVQEAQRVQLVSHGVVTGHQALTIKTMMPFSITAHHGLHQMMPHLEMSLA
jgi:uncharacterized protein YaaW (UPF0174 family)